MTNQDSDKKKQLTLGKLMLIVGLVKALIVVLFIQFRSHDVSQALSSLNPRRPAATQRNRRKPAVPNQPTGDQVKPATSWPLMALEQAVAFDPFATSELFAKKLGTDAPQTDTKGTLPSDLDVETLIAEEAEAVLPFSPFESKQAQLIKNQGISAIVSRGDERIALIGGREIRVGDRLGGFRVSAIGDEGVEFEVASLEQIRNGQMEDLQRGTSPKSSQENLE